MKKFAALFACLLLVAFAACAVAEPVTLAVLYPDTIDDKGWCQSMHKGVMDAMAKGYEIDYTYVESVQIPDAPNTLDQMADMYDIILVAGGQFSAATIEVAEEYPDQIFVLGTNDQILGDNIFTFVPMSEEPGYVNGVIAGMLTRNNKIGIVGPSDGADSARYVRGFVKALEDTNPEAAANYMLSWTGSFSDVVGAGDIGKTYIEAGCDVIVGPAQQGIGALRHVAAAEGITWVGQTFSQIEDFPSVVCSAADYDYSVIITSAIDRIAEGKTGGETIYLNYNNGGYVYTFSENTELMPEDVKAAAQAVLDKLIATPNTIDYSDLVLKSN